MNGVLGFWGFGVLLPSTLFSLLWGFIEAEINCLVASDVVV